MQLSNHPPSAVRIGLSPALMTLLDESGAVGTFATELGDLIGSIAGAPVQVHLTEDPGSTRDGALVATLNDVETSQKPASGVASLSPTDAELSRSENQVLELMLADRRHPICESVTIGRSSSCDISVDDSEISRRHAEVTNHEGTLVVRDLDSTNGTKVNGRTIGAPTALTAGDVILIGNTEISVVTA
jgi:pSer/pThr/pTyr-binding forkhead associated (FHA) protein